MMTKNSQTLQIYPNLCHKCYFQVKIFLFNFCLIPIPLKLSFTLITNPIYMSNKSDTTRVQQYNTSIISKMSEYQHSQDSVILELDSFDPRVDNDPEPQEQDIKSKQLYLRNEIVQKYQSNQQITELFEKYFEEKLRLKNIQEEVQQEVGLFTMAELQEMVKQFHELVKQLPKRQINAYPHQKSEIFEPPSQLNKVFYKNKAWDYQIICPNYRFDKEKPFFNQQQQKIKVKIIDYTEKTQSYGLFGMKKKVTLWLKLQTFYNNKSVIVERNIDDFKFVEQKLKHLYPFSFVPILKIKQYLNYQKSSSINKQIVSNCFQWMKDLFKKQQFYENIYFFKFLTEKQRRNYNEHQHRAENHIVSGIKDYKLINNNVNIFVSEANEECRNQIIQNSEYLQRSYSIISDCSTAIVQKITEIIIPLESLETQLAQLAKHCSLKYYQSNLTQLLDSFQDIITAWKGSFKSNQLILSQITQNFTQQCKKQWTDFNIYKKNIQVGVQAYQHQRLQFLQTQLKNTFSQISGQFDKSKINLLNLSQNKNQIEWEQRKTIWYGYMNSQFISTFNNLIANDEALIKKELVIARAEILKNRESLNKLLNKFKGIVPEYSGIG